MSTSTSDTRQVRRLNSKASRDSSRVRISTRRVHGTRTMSPTIGKTTNSKAIPAGRYSQRGKPWLLAFNVSLYLAGLMNPYLAKTFCAASDNT